MICTQIKRIIQVVEYTLYVITIFFHITMANQDYSTMLLHLHDIRSPDHWSPCCNNEDSIQILYQFLLIVEPAVQMRGHYVIIIWSLSLSQLVKLVEIGVIIYHYP